MRTMPKIALATALLLSAYATDSMAQAAPADAKTKSQQEAEQLAAPDASDARMVIVKNQDVSGKVFKRLGLPNQDYCWEQCLQERDCAATRWGVIDGSTAGQCQLLSGELTYGEPRDIKTRDGEKIVVTVSKKETGGSL